MCGRYATTRTSTDLSALFESYDDTGGRLVADYNVAPTDPVPVVLTAPPTGTASGRGGAEPAVKRSRFSDDATGTASGRGGAEPAVKRSRFSDGPDGDAPEAASGSARSLTLARWGLVPPWAKDVRGGARMINARAETVATTRAYARSFARRRCLVPADGWYEWLRRDDAMRRDGATRQAAGAKQAYFMTRADGGVLAFAGIWSIWSGGGEPLLTCSVITTAARGDLALVHDRMPLLLPPRRWAAWLAGGGEAAELLAPPADETLAAIEIRPVGRGVGDVRNDGPELVARVPAPPLGSPPEGTAALMLF